MERTSEEQLLPSDWLPARSSRCLVVTMTLSGYGVDHDPHGLGRAFPPQGLSPVTTVQLIHCLLAFQELKKRSIKVPVSFEGPWKTAPKIGAPSRTRSLSGKVHTARGKVIPSPSPLEKTTPAYPQTLQRLHENPQEVRTRIQGQRGWKCLFKELWW